MRLAIEGAGADVELVARGGPGRAEVLPASARGRDEPSCHVDSAPLH